MFQYRSPVKGKCKSLYALLPFVVQTCIFGKATSAFQCASRSSRGMNLGVVTALGQNVTDLEVGARVTAENTRYNCGICTQCANGSYNLCRNRLATGYAFDGAFAEYVVVPRSRIHRLPDNVDFRSGALTDPSACAYHAVQELTGINAGDLVLVSGPGPMGLFCLQYVKANGGTVILSGAERDTARLQIGHDLGADYVCTADKLNDLVNEVTGGAGLDCVLECSGAAAAAQQGLALLKSEDAILKSGFLANPLLLTWIAYCTVKSV